MKFTPFGRFVLAAAIVFSLTLGLLFSPAKLLNESLFWTEAASVSVVISEFRTRGPNGAADEFVELYNLSTAPVNIGGWRINGSNASAFVGPRATIPAGVSIPARGHYLITNSSASGGPYSGSVVGDQTFTTGITDDGGIALLDAASTIIDQVGMSSGSAYK